ncbi:hypothetical protein D3C81_1427880 [compost metagenome]
MPHHIHRYDEITRLLVLKYALQDTINLLRCRFRRQQRRSDGHLGINPEKTIEIPITERMVHECFGPLRRQGWRAHYIKHRHMLCCTARYAIQGTQFTDTEGGDEGRNTFDSRVSISSIGSIQLV